MVSICVKAKIICGQLCVEVVNRESSVLGFHYLFACLSYQLYLVCTVFYVTSAV